MDSSCGDLETKYNKIAAEYAKLRAQANVLKKAVVEEQSRNSALQDVLREREQNFRKTSQEIDSLTFRNQQLTKRVTFLQNELDASENRLKRGKSKIPENRSSVDCTTSMHILDEELQKKILENAELVSRMHDENSTHKQELAALHSQIDQLKHELQGYAESNKSNEKNNVDKLEVMPYGTAGQNQSCLQCQEQCSSQKTNDSNTSLLVNHLILENNFESTKNTRSCDKFQLQWMISDMSNHVFTLIAAVTNYHSLLDQRLNKLFPSASPVNQKLSSFLKESSSYLQSIQLCFSEIHGAGVEIGTDLLQSGLENLSDKLCTYASFLMKILPYQLFSIEEENAAFSNEEHIVSSNKLVAFHMNCVTNSFVKLSECIKLHCSESVMMKKQLSASPYKTFPILGGALMTLAKSLKDLASSYTVKYMKEQKITAFSEEVTKTNESIVNALSLMVDATDKICNTVSYDQIRVPTLVEMQESQNDDTSFTHLLDQDDVSEQITNNQKRMILLDQEKEHWHLEYQLLQIKHSKRTQELEEKLKIFESHISQGALKNQLHEENCQEQCTVTNLLGHLEKPHQVSVEMEAREQEVKNYLKSHIDRLVASFQEADTRAITFRAECAVLRKRLDHCISSKMQCECRLNDSLKQIMKLQEELQTTTHNYETQLSIMSEHLANMNEKLTLQTDEIDQLKYQLNSKTGNKRKQK